LTISPKGHSSSGRKRELGLGAVYAGGFAAARLRASGTDHDLKPLPPLSGIRLSASPFQFRSQEHRNRRASAQRFGGDLFALPMRKSSGFRTFRCLELALYHSLGKLPEPESIHDFF
jgi:hypothetical protein